MANTTGPYSDREVLEIFIETVRTLKAVEAAEKTGRTLRAIYLRRNKLGVPDARRRLCINVSRTLHD